ncbi:MAG: FtsX-like permease family protein [Gemmatimonadetes bacterium]|nr:FtsX-like permease family protein [Gemmatimonadota bacterium]
MSRPPLPTRLALGLLPKDFRHRHRAELLAGLAEERAGCASAWGRAWVAFRWVLDLGRVSAGLRFRSLWPSPSVPHAPQLLGLHLKQAFRSLRGTAGLTALAVMMVALGIGASTTVFSVANTLLMRPLPFADPDRLVFIGNGDWGRGQARSEISVQVGHLQHLLNESNTLEDVGGYHLFDRPSAHTLAPPGREPVRLTRLRVTPNFLTVLGVQPHLGRGFTTGEGRQGGPPVLLLTWDAWMRNYNGDPDVVGTSALIDDQPTLVAGVLPRAFDFPSIFAPGSTVDFLIPWAISAENSRSGNTLALIGRLAAGRTVGAARTEVEAIAARHHDERLNEFVPFLLPLRDQVSGSLRNATFVLAAAVFLVMAMLCANLSNLLLSRGATRQRELAVRAALGASRRTLLGQLFYEGLILSLAGGVLGVAVAVAATRVIARSGGNIPLLRGVGVDSTVLVFALAASIGTGLLFTVLPALRASATPPQEVLRAGTRGASAGREERRLRSTLVIAQISLACLLLIGAGLLLKSFRELSRVDLGFEPRETLTARIDPGRRFVTTEERSAWFGEILAAVREAPGVESAGWVDVLPVEFNRRWCVRVQSDVGLSEDCEPAQPFVRIISDGYLAAMGVRLFSGRAIGTQDHHDATPVALVNDRLAQIYWPGEDPLGASVRTSGVDYTVVGVTQGMRHLSPDQPPEPEIFFSHRQLGDYRALNLIVRGPVNQSLSRSIREAVRRAAPSLAMDPPRRVQGLVDSAVSSRRFLMVLVSTFAATALMLASLGIYGVLSYTVNQRRREMGIRLALGQSRSSLLMGVMGDVGRQAGAGLAAGLVAAAVLTRVLDSQLYGVTRRDPVVFGGVLGLMALVALAAAYIPANRAARTDPVAVLNSDT